MIIDIKVKPSSGRQGFALDKSGKIKCFLKNPPEKGKANKELISLLSKCLGAPKTDIEIILGATNRNKRIKVDQTLTLQQLYDALGIENQLSIE